MYVRFVWYDHAHYNKVIMGQMPYIRYISTSDANSGVVVTATVAFNVVVVAYVVVVVAIDLVVRLGIAYRLYRYRYRHRFYQLYRYNRYVDLEIPI